MSLIAVLKRTTMKIYENNDTLMHYEINPTYFEKHHDISKLYFTESYWSNGEAGTSVLTYNISYTVKHPDGVDYFIRYERKLKLRCLIENIYQDTHDIIKIKEAMNSSIDSFLQQNALSFYDMLGFKPLTFSEPDRLSEKAGLQRLNSLFQ